MTRRLALLSLLVLVAACFAGCGPKIYDVALPDIAASDDAELLARGEYLFHGPSHCSACHTTKDVGMAISAGVKPLPTGGGVWHMGPIGTLYSPNLTPDESTGIGRYTDAQIARAIRHGVLPDGRLSFLMTIGVGRIADDDIRALITYMRSLEPTTNEVPPSEMGLLGNMVFSGVPPKQAGPERAPPLAATVERGKYLAEGAAACMGCHSPIDLGTGVPKPGTAFTGGDVMASELDDDPNEYKPRNITPDKETGIGSWTEEQFLARFAAGRLHRGSPMPWGNYQNMQPDDVRALWMFLQTVPAVKNDTGPTVIPK